MLVAGCSMVDIVLELAFSAEMIPRPLHLFFF